MPPNADLYPSLFFWWSIVSKFTENARNSWPAHVEQAGAAPAKESGKQAKAGKGKKADKP